MKRHNHQPEDTYKLLTIYTLRDSPLQIFDFQSSSEICKVIPLGKILLKPSARTVLHVAKSVNNSIIEMVYH